MEDFDEKKESLKRKRVVFTDTDTQLLMECVRKHGNVINNKKTSRITPAMKAKVKNSQETQIVMISYVFLLQAWDSIKDTFNSSQTGGVKTLQEIQKKYQNMKCIAKKEIAASALEIKKTGGGTASVITESVSSVYDFSATQIEGHQNIFDSDYVDVQSTSAAPPILVGDDDNTNSSFNFDAKDYPVTPNYSSKKMKMSGLKLDLVSLKEEGMKLDNEGKKLYIKLKA